MKILLVLSLLLISATVYSDNTRDMRANVLRVLHASNISVQDLEQNGKKLLLGEFTGAGLVPIGKVDAFITQNDVVFKNEVREILFNDRALQQTLINLRAIHVDDKIVDRSNMLGFIVE